MAILDLIQQGTEAAKRYAQLASPVINFAKGLAIGPSEAYISGPMRDQLIQKAKETELDKGTLGYEAFGLPVSAEGGRFTGGLFDLAIKDPVAFGNVGSVGRVSFEKDPTEPGGYKFGDIEYDFTPDKDTGSTGNVLLDFINRGGFQSTPVGQAVYDLGGRIADLNLGFTSAAAAEPPSKQKFSQQFSVTQQPQFDLKGAQLFEPSNIMTDSVMEDVVDTPTREFGDIRAGQPELGIFGVREIQDVPVNLEELAALEDDIIEQQLAAASRGEGETFFDRFRDVGGNVLDFIKGGGFIGRGITSLANTLGDTFKGSRFYNPRTASGNRLFAPGARVGDRAGLQMRRDAASISRMLNRLSQGKPIGENRLADLQRKFGLEGIDTAGMAKSIAESAQTGYGGYGSAEAAAAAAKSGGRDYSTSPGAMKGDMEYDEE